MNTDVYSNAYCTIRRWKTDWLTCTNNNGRWMVVWDWYMLQALSQGKVTLTLNHKVAVVDDYGTLVPVDDFEY